MQNALVPIDKLKATAEPVTVVTILNPFKPYDRTILRKDWQPGKGIDYYTGYLPVLADVELVASVNGRVVRDWSDVEVYPGDFIAVCPLVAGGGGGKKILRLVGMLAVAFIAHIAAAPLAGAIGLTSAIGATAATMVMKGLIGVMGAMIINAIAPAPKPDIPRIGHDAWNESPTYSWNVLRNLNTQGNPIPVLYGTMRIAGQIISKVVDVDGDKQYLNVLVAVAGHEVDSLTDIEINGQPESYYHGVTSYTRLGTNSDSVIPGFNEVATQQTFGTKLNYGSPVTYETDGNAVEKIKLHIIAPYGCYYANDQGGLDSRSASFQVQYRVKGTSTWTTQGSYTISGATTKRLSRTVTFDTPSADQYEVRVQRTNTESSSARERTAIYWTAMTEIIKRSLIYPGIAKYAVRALATDQLSGAEPTFTVKATRSTVQVYNPSTSSWESRSASNPAWAAYDLLVNETYGGGIDHTRIDYDAFEAWASYCDETVQGETRFELNIYIDSQMTLWEALLTICKAGRAVPVRKGTQYSVIVDKPSTPVQMFTMADIKAGTFKETFLQKKDRANAIEVTYIDEDRGYTRQTVAVYTDDYNDADEPDNKQSMRLIGCTRRTQAIREAAFHLNSTKWLVRTCEFEVDIQALACQVGDRIYIQHDVPKYGHGGRVVEATSTTVTVDHDVVPVLGSTNVIAVLHNDDSIEEKTVTQLDYKNNLIVNGNFERDSVGTQTPDGWTRTDVGSPTTREVYATSQDESGGDNPWWREDAHTYKVKGTNTDYCKLITTDYVSILASTSYNLNVWTKLVSGEDGIAKFNLYFYDASDVLVGSSFKVFNVDSSDWEHQDHTFTSPSNAVKMKLEVILASSTSSLSEFLITRIQVVEGEEPVEWLSKLTVSSSWSSTPEQYERYAFGEQDSYRKPYTVVNISRGADLDKKITCVEYIEDIYTDTGYVFEAPTWDVDYQEATKVYLHEFLSFSPDGTYASNLAVTWHPSISIEHYSWHIWLEDLTSGDDPVFVGQADTMHFVIGPQYLTLDHQYKVYVVQLGQGPKELTGNTATITIQGEYAPPSDVTSFSGVFDSVTRNVKFTWTAIDDIDLDHYEIRKGGTDWDSATVIIEHATGTTASWYVEDTTNDTIRFWIKAVDRAGVYSENAAYDDVDIDTSSCSLQQPTGLSLSTFSEIADDGTDHVFVRAEWNNNAENSDDFHHYDVRLVKEPSGSGYTSHYSTFETSYLWEVKPNTEYGVYVRAVDRGGNATNWTTMVTITSAKDSTAPSAPSITLTEFFSAIRINISHGGEYDLDHFDIYKNSTNNSSTATKIGSTSTTRFVYTPGDRNTYYYWAKSVDNSGNVSEFSNVVSGKLLRVDTDDLEDELITSQKLVDNAVTEVKVATGAITTTKISDGAIESPKIAAGAITSGKIAAGAVIADKIDANAVTSQKIAAGAVTADKIDANAVTAEKIQSGAVTTDKLDALAVTTEKLDAGAVTASKIDVTKLSDINPNAGVITAGTLQSGNWGSSAGSKFYLGDGTFYLGGSSDPKLSWNGTTLEIEGEVNITGGSGASNLDDYTPGVLPLANLLVNPGLEDSTDPDWWTNKSAASVITSGGSGSNRYLRLLLSGSTKTSYNAEGPTSETRHYFEVNEGDVFEFGGDAFASGCTARLGLARFNKNKSYITSYTVQTTSTGWTSLSGTYTIPSGTKFIGFFVQGSGSSGHAGFDNLYLRKIDSLSAGWGHSSDITKIDGGNIYTGTITATQLIQTEALITESAQIDDATIGTLHVKEDNITVVSGAYTHGQIDCPTGSWTTVQSVSVQPKGGEVHIVFSSKVSGIPGFFRIYEGSSLKWSSTYTYVDNMAICVSFTGASSGTQTYYVKVKPDNGLPTKVRERGLLVQTYLR